MKIIINDNKYNDIHVYFFNNRKKQTKYSFLEKN